MALPRTQYGLLLWRNGDIAVVPDWGNLAAYESADDHIAGGCEWVGEDTSWQAISLAANGFTLIPVEV
jgi:hypothetical protein